MWPVPPRMQNLIIPSPPPSWAVSCANRRTYHAGTDASCRDVVVDRHGRQHRFVGDPILFEVLAGSHCACAYQAHDSVSRRTLGHGRPSRSHRSQDEGWLALQPGSADTSRPRSISVARFRIKPCDIPPLSQPCPFTADAGAQDAAPLVGIELVGERARGHETTRPSAIREHGGLGSSLGLTPLPRRHRMQLILGDPGAAISAAVEAEWRLTNPYLQGKTLGRE